MPTLGYLKARLADSFPTPPSGFDLALGVRPRRAPEKLPKIDHRHLAKAGDLGLEAVEEDSFRVLAWEEVAVERQRALLRAADRDDDRIGASCTGLQAV